MALVADSEINQGIVQQGSTSGDTPLRNLTDFEWDRAGFVQEGATAEEIAAAFGDRLIKQDRYVGAANLLVFSREGKIVRAVMVSADRLHPADARRWWGSSVVLHTEAAGGIIRWREP